KGPVCVCLILVRLKACPQRTVVPAPKQLASVHIGETPARVQKASDYCAHRPVPDLALDVANDVTIEQVFSHEPCGSHHRSYYKIDVAHRVVRLVAGLQSDVAQ